MVKQTKIKDIDPLPTKLSLGWLLNCPVSKSDDIVENNASLIQSLHVLKVSCEVKNEVSLTQNL